MKRYKFIFVIKHEFIKRLINVSRRLDCLYFYIYYCVRGIQVMSEMTCSFIILTDYTLNIHIEIILKLQTREFEHFWARIEGIKVFGDALICGLGV